MGENMHDKHYGAPENWMLNNIPEGSILGINYNGGHDTAIALVSPEGQPLFAISLERISRSKQDGRSPELLLKNFPWQKISKVAISVAEKISDVDSLSNKLHPISLINPYAEASPHPDLFSHTLAFIPVEKIFVSHHLSHAASAFWYSNFSEATCLVYDGGMCNEHWFGGAYQASIANGIQPIDLFSIRNYSNFALLYASITGLLGFKPLKHEGKITGLAAYGEPKQDCRILLTEWAHHPEILRGFLKWKNLYSSEAIPQLETDLGEFLPIKQALERFSREDIAATIQTIAEEHIIEIIKNMAKQGIPIKNICLAGGLFANVKINQRVSESGCEHLYIAPPMSDDGTALGAALEVAFNTNKIHKVRSHSGTMYLGPSYSNEEIQEAILKNSLKVERSDNPAEAVAALLAKGEIVGIFQGALEFGPRALGNRSILAPANDPLINQRLNELLSRTEFMPFAPISQIEDAELLYQNIERVKLAAEFMTVSVNCTEEMKRLCPAVVHIDGTARPQLVSDTVNPFIHSVLGYYKKFTGYPALVNTSFNLHEEPIICSPEDAIKSFFEAGLDALYLEGNIIKLDDNKTVEVDFLRKKIHRLVLTCKP